MPGSWSNGPATTLGSGSSCSFGATAGACGPSAPTTRRSSGGSRSGWAERAAELWRDRAGDHDAWHGQDDLWRKHDLWEETESGGAGRTLVDAPACSPEGSREMNPKAAPILRVVGRAQRHEDIRAYSHALVELEVVTERRAAPDGAEPRIRWFDRLPAPIGASNARGGVPPHRTPHSR